MAFRLDPRHALAPQLRTVLLEQCRVALAALRVGDAAAVHEVRRCGKRSRALLRLARPGLPGKVFKRLNRMWREVGRQLSDVRDHAVIAQTLGLLAKRYPDVLAPEVMQQLRHRLNRRVSPTATVRNRLRTGLTTLCEDLRHAELSARWRDAATGHARSHAAGLAAQTKATTRAHAEDRHSWRKRVKDLHHQAHLLARLWPAEGETWHHLGNVLGHEHDLVVLRSWLAHVCQVPGITRVRRQAQRWQRHLRALGNRLAKDLPDDPEYTRQHLLGARRALR